METFLEKYISLADKKEGDATMEEYNFMKPTIFVNNHIDNNISIDEFKDKIKNEDIEEQITAMFICDFDHGEEDKLVEQIKENGGICKVKLNAPNPITCESDKEDNCIYMVFPNPVIAFTYAKQLNIN